ncbi:uncharacterized protein LOC112539484 [Tetranychus urticae]|uniref:uncharacterized protein LOC112539484 n=1 Tax=Tetranychus urticae TaxID=32264 RepID=UPI000D644C7D|nr:uncharacterized protein LOC112539484 [Tetranychus urticae]
MNCILNVFNTILLLILTPTLTETTVKPTINCNHLTLNNIFTSSMKQSTHNGIWSEHIDFDSNFISNFWSDQRKSDLPKLQSTYSYSNWETRSTGKCPIDSIDNSSDCSYANCTRSSTVYPFHHFTKMNANAKLDSSMDYSVVSSLIGQLIVLPLIDLDYKTSLIYNASESSIIHSLLAKVEFKQFLQTFLKLEKINEKVDNQTQQIINLINEAFKIGQFKALLLSANTKWSTHHTWSSIVTTKISLHQVKLSTQNLIRNMFTVLIVTNETSKLIFCSSSNSRRKGVSQEITR